MTKKQESIKSKVLFIEGTENESNDYKFFYKILEFLNLENTIEIKPIGKKIDIKTAIDAVIERDSTNSITSIGIIIDADDNKNISIKSIEEKINKSVLIKKEFKNYKIFCITDPNNSSKGVLEDLLCQVLSSDEEFICTTEFCKCLNIDNKKKIIKFYLDSKKNKNKSYFDIDILKEFKSVEEIINFIKEI